MKLSGRHYTIVVLILVTAILHFGAAFDRQLFPDHRPDLLFTLNGLGYLGLLGAYFLPLGFLQANRRLVWGALVGYILLTLLAWLVIWVGFNVIRDGMPFFGHDSLYGVPSKIAEVALLFQLWPDKPAGTPDAAVRQK